MGAVGCNVAGAEGLLVAARADLHALLTPWLLTPVVSSLSTHQPALPNT